MIEKIELLAPAGGAAQLRAAVQSGADAVYMGGYAFNARYSAKNFTSDEMRDMMAYCRLYGVKTHVAVNTLIKEHELEALLKYVCELNELGADALIIQDIGAAEMIRRVLPDIELHASTQMTVTSLEGVKYLEDMGFDRVVLARELSRDEIAHICAHSKAQIEVFVHGAICQCYSGQCLMSSILGGRSGNRGRCAQPCRLSYSLTDGKKNAELGYLLSPKDMALINELEELREIGVASLKIEGRLKRAEYVSAVTGIYRKYLDFPGRVSAKDFEELKSAFSRSGFTNGYFTGKLGAEMMSGKSPSNSGSSFSNEAKARAAENADIRKVKVNIAASVFENSPIEITMYDNDGHYATASGECAAEKAQRKPLDESRIKEQLKKLGGTPFFAESVEVSVGDGLVIPIKDINMARRLAGDELMRQRSEVRPGRVCPFEFRRVSRAKSKITLTASVRTEEQAIIAAKHGIKRIYAPFGIAEKLKNIEIVAASADIFEPKKSEKEEVMVSSNGAAYFYKGKRLCGDFRLNVCNSLAANHYSGFQSVALSPELNLKEIGALVQNTETAAEVIAYGHIPLMIMKNCPLKAAGKCQRGKIQYKLKDRKNEEFPVICGSGCVCEILNSKPVFMADKLNDIIQYPINYIRLSFTVESPEACGKIIDIYLKALNGAAVENPFEMNAFTRGHFYRGVE